MQDRVRLHHTIQNTVHFKTYELLISESLIFFRSWLSVNNKNCRNQNRGEAWLCSSFSAFTILMQSTVKYFGCWLKTCSLSY